VALCPQSAREDASSMGGQRLEERYQAHSKPPIGSILSQVQLARVRSNAAANKGYTNAVDATRSRSGLSMLMFRQSRGLLPNSSPNDGSNAVTRRTISKEEED